jgi:ankyrin repeat protein
MLACQHFQFGMIQFLVQYSANINHSNIDGNTALTRACQDRNVDAVKFLVCHGASVNQANDEVGIHACDFSECV